MIGIIVGTVILATVIGSATSWYLSMNRFVYGMDDKLEAMTVATSEWNRLEHMSLDDLESARETFKEPWAAGDKYKVSLELGEKGVFDEGVCKTSLVASSVDEYDCFDDTIMKIYEADTGNVIYTTRQLPMSSTAQSGVPVGTIISYDSLAWATASEQKKWLLCNGQAVDANKYPKLYKLMHNVPDLRDRFLTGAGSSYSLGDKGGENLHTLTVNEIPSHKHLTPFNEAYDAGNYPWGVSSGGHYGSDGGSDGDNWWAYTSPVGGNGAHENRPPYYAVLYYIRAK